MTSAAQVASEEASGVDGAHGVVVVGAGHAGFQCVDSLRRNGYQGQITLVNAEPDLPYQRPPLSKGHLLSPAGEEALWFRAANWFDDQQIQLLSSTRATAIDTERRQVELDTGETLVYRWLVLAPGATLRKLDCAGADLDGIGYVKSLADIRQLQNQLPNSEQVVVVGSSFIALEFAATARKLGKNVTVLVRSQRLMNNAVDQELAEYMLDQHQQQGVVFRFGVVPTAIIGTEGSVSAVELSDGEQIPADLLVAGIGVVMDTSLAQAAGLECGQPERQQPEGILVNSHCETSQPGVFAAGDLVVAPNFWSATADSTQPLMRVESVQNAVDQAKLIAEMIAKQSQPASEADGDGVAKPEYRNLPWFWSDQYDIKLQMAGLFEGYDQCVLRGDMASGKFSRCYLKQGKLIAVHSVNKPADHMQARKLIEAGACPAPQDLADESQKLKSLMPS